MNECSVGTTGCHPLTLQHHFMNTCLIMRDLVPFSER